MRIALSGWFWNRPETGSGQYLRQLLHELAGAHSEIDWLLVAPPAHVTGQPAVPGSHVIPLQALPGPVGKVLWEQVMLPAAVRRLEVHLLHVPYWAPPALAPCPTVVTIHDLIPRLLPPYRGGLNGRLYTGLVSATAKRATRLLTDSEAARRDIVQTLGIPPARVRAVYLAAAPVFTSAPAAGDAAILARYGLRSGYIFYLGGFDIRKNLAAGFAAAARALPACDPALRLVVAGKLPREDSTFAPDPRRLAREAGLRESQVRFLGYVADADKPALYRAARAFLFPSRYEGFGLPPLEALACGVPVVGSARSSLPEVVGDAGVLVDPDDVVGMAQALARICTDADVYTELRNRALRQAAGFSWTKAAAETFATYREAWGF
ncbi:MAG: glycosyltransferase family 4 protein [Anaerolineae bacterium]|nr:glycosyltransferase family 4 protein [Anaerolineae bacterium]